MAGRGNVSPERFAGAYKFCMGFKSASDFSFSFQVDEDSAENVKQGLRDTYGLKIVAASIADRRERISVHPNVADPRRDHHQVTVSCALLDGDTRDTIPTARAHGGEPRDPRSDQPGSGRWQSTAVARPSDRHERRSPSAEHDALDSGVVGSRATDRGAIGRSPGGLTDQSRATASRQPSRPHDARQGTRAAVGGDAVAVAREPQDRPNTARGGSPSPPRHTRPEPLRQQGSAAPPPQPVDRGSRRLPSASSASSATAGEATQPRDARAVAEEAARTRPRVSDQTRLAVRPLQPGAAGSDSESSQPPHPAGVFSRGAAALGAASAPSASAALLSPPPGTQASRPSLLGPPPAHLRTLPSRDIRDKDTATPRSPDSADYSPDMELKTGSRPDATQRPLDTSVDAVGIPVLFEHSIARGYELQNPPQDGNEQMQQPAPSAVPQPLPSDQGVACEAPREPHGIHPSRDGASAAPAARTSSPVDERQARDSDTHAGSTASDAPRLRTTQQSPPSDSDASGGEPPGSSVKLSGPASTGTSAPQGVHHQHRDKEATAPAPAMIAATDPESRLQTAASPAAVGQARASSSLTRLVHNLSIDANGVHAEHPQRKRVPPAWYTPPADALGSSSRGAAAQLPQAEARRGQATLAAQPPPAEPAATRSQPPADQPPATAAATTVSMTQLDGRLQEPRASKPTQVVDLTGISDSDSEPDVEAAARPADAKSDTSTLLHMPASASGEQGCPGPTRPSLAAPDARLLAAASADAIAVASTSEGTQREAQPADGTIIERPLPAPPPAASVSAPPRTPSGEGAGRVTTPASSIARRAQPDGAQPGRPTIPHHPAGRGPGRVAPVTARAAPAPRRSSNELAVRTHTAGGKRRRGQASNQVPADVDADRPADIVKPGPKFKRVPLISRRGGDPPLGRGGASAERMPDSEGDYFTSHLPSQRSQLTSDSESDHVPGAATSDSFARRDRGAGAQPAPAHHTAPPEAPSPSDSEMPPHARATIAGGQATGARVESGPLQHLLLHIAASESAWGAAVAAPGSVALAQGARATAEAPAGLWEAASTLLAPAMLAGPPGPGLSAHDVGASAPPEAAGPDSEYQHRDSGDTDESEQLVELALAATPPLFADE